MLLAFILSRHSNCARNQHMPLVRSTYFRNTKAMNQKGNYLVRSKRVLW